MRKSFRLISIALLLIAAALAQPQPKSISVTIAGGASESSVASLAGCTPAALLTPTTAQGWTTASIGVKVTIDNTNYFEAYDVYGTKFSITAAVDRWIILPPSDTWSFFSMKLTSIDGSGNAVVQAANRTIRIICR